MTCRHVGILSIQGSQFQIAEVPLKTVRPFELEELVLAEDAEKLEGQLNLEDRDSITAYLRQRVSSSWSERFWELIVQVEELIVKAKPNWEELHKDDVEKTEMMLPLIRLKVGLAVQSFESSLYSGGDHRSERDVEPRPIWARLCGPRR